MIDTCSADAGPDPLAGMAAAIAGSVRASYLAITDVSGAVLAEHGTAPSTELPKRALTVGGHPVGALAVGPAPGESSLPAADERLVEALAVPVAIVLHAGRLNRELLTARTRLEDATAAERARLRHDLHDGLGPSLSGVALGLEAIEATLVDEPERATAIVGRLRLEVARAVEEIRRIIEALAPAGLEAGGLDRALRERAAVAAIASGLRIEVHTDPLPEMPEPIAVALYRIVDEAITNVLRHAQATRCLVRVNAGDEVRIEVRDDGRGFDGSGAGGLGLASMRRRAEGMGGTFEVSGSVGGRVVATLPLPEMTPS